MGMEQVVTFPGGRVPRWDAVSTVLERAGFPVQLRMIDNELALPDEIPPEPWRELRVGTLQGMITLRREAARVVLVTWGNADTGLREAWNALTWAVAHAGQGFVETAAGPQSAADFREAATLPTGLSGPEERR